MKLQLHIQKFFATIILILSLFFGNYNVYAQDSSGIYQSYAILSINDGGSNYKAAFEPCIPPTSLTYSSNPAS